MVEKTASAYFGILLLYFSQTPAGIIWSVVILSPSFMRTAPLTPLSNLTAAGKGLMFGPLIISTAVEFFAGGIIKESFTKNLSGIFISGYSPSFRGSAMTPCMAAAAAVSGLHK